MSRPGAGTRESSRYGPAEPWNRPRTTISSAVAGVVLTRLTTAFGSVTVPSENGFRIVMALGTAAALVALAIAAFLPSRSR